MEHDIRQFVVFGDGYAQPREAGFIDELRLVVGVA
jgi:hypothetical protein